VEVHITTMAIMIIGITFRTITTWL